MTPKLYEQVCCICYDGLQLETSQLSPFLDRICAGDALLPREVEARLAYEVDEESFLAASALVITLWKRDGTLVVTFAPSHSPHSTMLSSPLVTRYASTSAVSSLAPFMSSTKGQRRPMNYQTSTYSFPTRRLTAVRRKSESDRWCRSHYPARISSKIVSSSTRKRGREYLARLVGAHRSDLEAIKGWANPKDHGAVRDPNRERHYRII
jgi:hypothetical protein